MIFNLFHLIFGCICFTASGGFAERFINVCTAKGIQLWGIRKKSYGLTACTTIEGYKKIINAARASGMKVRIKRKSGFRLLSVNMRATRDFLSVFLLCF